MESKNNQELKIISGAKDWGEAEYPKDHQFGSAVTLPGSSCSNCEYLKDREKKICGNFYFIKWNKGNKIPTTNLQAYCCDEWHPQEKK